LVLFYFLGVRVIEALVCAFFAFSILQVRFHPSSSEVLASGSLDNEVRLWDATTAECVGSRDFCNITNLLIYISFVMKLFFLFSCLSDYHFPDD
jgi:WD40 repeat protein